jgi:hypothetical protein
VKCELGSVQSRLNPGVDGAVRRKVRRRASGRCCVVIGRTNSAHKQRERERGRIQRKRKYRPGLYSLWSVAYE